jgi:hypothetical protein
MCEQCNARLKETQARFDKAPKAKAIGPEEVNRRFDYHRPSGQAQSMHSSLRRSAKVFAEYLTDTLPEGREKSLAFTAFEEATFWAHAAIARDPSLHEPEAK